MLNFLQRLVSDNQTIKFLKRNRDSWKDWNITYKDGELLYKLALKHKYRKILDLGTSTGHSAIWLGMAAQMTDGRVITIDAHEGRGKTALENFDKAGVSRYIELQSGNCRELVPYLEGPFDFVFCDADKDWYFQYFCDLESKISIGGCFAAHNVLWNDSLNIKWFLEYVKKNPRFRTRIIKAGGEGISLSFRSA